VILFVDDHLAGAVVARPERDAKLKLTDAPLPEAEGWASRCGLPSGQRRAHLSSHAACASLSHTITGSPSCSSQCSHGSRARLASSSGDWSCHVSVMRSVCNLIGAAGRNRAN
jgi:hypothetical protein